MNSVSWGSRRTLCVAALCLGTVTSDAQAACLHAKADRQVAEGRLLSIQFTDFAGRKEQAYILQLARPACLEGDDEYDKIDRTNRIHVYSMEDKLRRQMRGLIGKIVRVTGSPFGEHTSYHHAPIVMNIRTIERR